MQASTSPPKSSATGLFQQIWAAVGGNAERADAIEIVGDGDLPSAFAVTDLAAASIGSAGAAIAELLTLRHGDSARPVVDRRLASIWFAWSLRPTGWTPPPPWDPIAGDYRAADGWIRLHTNAPHHREAALAVLGTPADKDSVARAAAGWNAVDLETAIVANGGCAAAMRSVDAWGAHDQGQAVAREPLLQAEAAAAGPIPAWAVERERPLRGIRVLDLTRVLAGPVATRFLAGFGADVLRIDPPGWDEPSVVPEVTLGKRCARLDLRDAEDRSRFEHLLGEADILVHGYRPGALDGLGFTAGWRRRIRPGLVEVSLDAYGWTGPWQRRRGFDSLVQMSAGIADEGMRRLGRDRPTPLPVQALDHATGYLLATAAIRGLAQRLRTGAGYEARCSLARMAQLLICQPHDADRPPIAAESPSERSGEIEHTYWGPAHRLKPPIEIAGTPMRWDLPAGPLGAASATWLTA
jgi:crotonobetainyl-CoA:carnitine CoA-transferase CaiB-like acyl-CoA transferase